MFVDSMGRGGGGRGPSGRYILDGHKPVPCEDLFEWARWFETASRRVAFTPIHGVHVSTVFLALDHNYDGGPPLLFETMIFGGGADGEQMRCSSWEEAEAVHRTCAALARRAKRKPGYAVLRKQQRAAMAALRATATPATPSPALPSEQP